MLVILVDPHNSGANAWSGITPEEAGLEEDTWPMPDGSSIVGVKIADHGRRSLPDGVIKVSRDYRRTVGIEKKTNEDPRINTCRTQTICTYVGAIDS